MHHCGLPESTKNSKRGKGVEIRSKGMIVLMDLGNQTGKEWSDFLKHLP